MIDRLIDRLAEHLAEWPWTQTMVAVTLALCVAFVVAPFVLSYLDKPLPSDTALDHIRNLLTIMLPSAVGMAIGKRATTKVDVMRFDAEQRGEAS